MLKLGVLVEGFDSTDLEGIKSVDFGQRVDTKFIFSQHKLETFLNRIKNDCRVLEVGTDRAFNYRNVYYDKADFEFFRHHQSGRANRMKIRARAYGDKGPFFLEVKRKTNKGLTVKSRLLQTSFNDEASPLTADFLIREVGLTLEDLPIRTGVNYTRITLADSAFREKFTLDVGLSSSFENNSYPFEGLAIAEVKQEKFTNQSIFMKALKAERIYPSSFSKYCNAVMKHHLHLKKNRFKTVLRNLNRITQVYGTAS